MSPAPVMVQDKAHTRATGGWWIGLPLIPLETVAPLSNHRLFELPAVATCHTRAHSAEVHGATNAPTPSKGTQSRFDRRRTIFWF